MGIVLSMGGHHPVHRGPEENKMVEAGRVGVFSLALSLSLPDCLS